MSFETFFRTFLSAEVKILILGVLLKRCTFFYASFINICFRYICVQATDVSGTGCDSHCERHTHVTRQALEWNPKGRRKSRVGALSSSHSPTGYASGSKI